MPIVDPRVGGCRSLFDTMPEVLELLFSNLNHHLTIRQMDADFANFLQDEGSGIINFDGYVEGTFDHFLGNFAVAQVSQLINQFCS